MLALNTIVGSWTGDGQLVELSQDADVRKREKKGHTLQCNSA